MSSKHQDNDIDRLFKNAIEPVETEPSDKFWNRAYDNIIKTEGRVNNNQVRRWKVIAYTLAAFVIILAFFTFYMNGKINTIQKQVTEVEKNQVAPIAHENESNNGSITTTHNNTAIAQLNTTPAGNNNTSIVVVTNPVTSGSSNTPNTVGAATTTISSTISNSTPLVSSVVKNYSTPGSNNTGTASTPVNSGSPVNQMLPGNYYSKADSNTVISEINKPASTTSEHKDSNAIAQQTPAVAPVKKDTIPALAETKPTSDTVSTQMRRTRASHIKFSLSNLYASAFFAPGLTVENIKDNDSWDNVTAGDVKSHEDGQFNYSSGVKAGFDITKHISVLTGLNYYSSSFSIQPTIIHAQWYNNTASYLMVTSAGTVDIPCPGYQTIGDSIKASGTSTAAYISIPLQARYTFNNSHKLGLYADAGVTANFLINNNVDAYWQTTSLTEGHASIPSCEGLENSFYNYTLGFGLSYKLMNNLSVFGEPEFRGAITPINNNSSITTYPYIFSFAIGLTWHL